MAHWAQIDENSIVVTVTVGDNNDPAGDEGYSWLIENLGGTWVKTSYNCLGGIHYTDDENGNRVPSGKPHLRYNYAGIGSLYDPIKDAFIPPKPPIGNNWILNEETCLWERPVEGV
jgi:hypothetical protein